MSKKSKKNAPKEKGSVPPSEEDQPVQTESHADGIVDAIEKNRMMILFGAGAVLAILFGVIIIKQIAKQKHLEAGRAFTKAAAAKSIDALDKVIVDFPGSIAAGNAFLTKADIQIDQGNSQDAIQTLQEMTGKSADHPRFAQACFMLANVYHKADDFARAKEHYEKVLSIQPDGELTPISRIRLGDLALAQGDSAKAEQHYQESFNIHPGNPFAQTAQRRIAKLSIGTPPEIDRPEPPKEEKPEPKPEQEGKKDPENAKAEPERKETSAPKGKAAKGKKGKQQPGQPASKSDQSAAPKGKKAKGKSDAPKKGSAKGAEKVPAEVEVIE